MNTAFLSFDIETDGPSPIINSLLSLGIALITDDGVVIDTLSVNIKKRDGMKEDDNTMKWWKTQPLAWEKCHQNMLSPEEAMVKVGEFYQKWTSNYKLFWVGSPVCFDWMFLKSYYSAFSLQNSIDIGFKAIDMATLRDYSIKCKIITNKEFDLMVSTIPKGEEHIAIEDAINQGLIFVNLIKLIKSKTSMMNQKKQKS